MNRQPPQQDRLGPQSAGPGSTTAVGIQDARPGPGRGGRPAVLVLTVVVAVLAVCITWAADSYREARIEDFPAFTVLLVAAAASAGLRFGHAQQRVSFSFTAVVLLAAIPLVGPLGAVLLGVGAAVLDARQGWWQAWTFNGMMFGLAAAVASLVYGAVGGAFVVDGRLVVNTPGTPGPEVLITSVLGPLLLSDIAFLLTNLAVLLVVTRKDAAAPSRVRLVAGVLWTSPLFLAWGVVAFVVIVLWAQAGVGPLAILLVIAPLVMARHIYGLLSDERRVRASIIDALAGAGRDNGMLAHGDRVVGYATAIAAEMGLRPAERSVLQYTARLHGVGSRQPCSRALRLGADPRESVAAALVAHQVVGLIGFLDASAQAIRHQAEWFDGSGGPDGLAGSVIPRDARILAVADAVDLVVRSSGSDRPACEALVEIRALAGTRFDPAVVDAFARTLRPPPDGPELEIETESQPEPDPLARPASAVAVEPAVSRASTGRRQGLGRARRLRSGGAAR